MPSRSKPDHELIRQLREEGNTTAKVAELVGLSPRQVQRIYQSPERRLPTPPYPTEVREAALVLLKDRTGYAEAARTLGVGQRVLRKWYPGMGLTQREVQDKINMLRRYGEVLND